MWGVLINGIQAASLEHVDMTTASWNGATSKPLTNFHVTLMFMLPNLCSWFVDRLYSLYVQSPDIIFVRILIFSDYCPAMIILYTVAPLLYRMASSAFYNISLLTSDFYGLLFGTFSSNVLIVFAAAR